VISVKPLLTILVPAILLLFFLVLPVSAGYVWENATVDAAENYGWFTSLAFDNAGNPAISYCDGSYRLKYAWNDGGVWQDTTVLGAFGRYTSLAFDNDGFPAISFRSSGSNNLMYAWEDEGGWHTTTVDGEREVWDTSLAFDGTYPAIGYADETNTALRYAWQDGGGWHNTTVDAAGTVGQFCSLAFDTDGNPAISYYGNGVLKYAWQEAGVWENTTVDAAGTTVGTFTSLAFDADGNPAISYFGNNHLKYAWMEGGVWENTTVDATNNVGYYTSLAFDADGNPAISNYDFSNEDLRFAWMEGGAWHTTVVDAVGAVGRYTSLAFDTDGNPAISYCDWGNGLKYAYATPDAGTIAVTSAPAGAAVWLDGVDTATTTPASLADVPSGTHNVTVMLDGYLPGINESVPVTFGQTIDVAFDLAPLPPVADFTATPGSGNAPLAVQFTDTSSGVVDAWSWDFGDGASSTAQNPGHSYAAGTYTVTLTVENAAGNDTAVRTDLVTAVNVVRPQGGGGGGNSQFVFDNGRGTILTSSEGAILRETTITATDGIATLLLPQGTIALDGDGDPVTEITIEKINASEVPSAPDGATFSFAGFAYECSPAGATFAPGITLVFTLPAEEWEALDGDVSVQFYDEETGAWVEIPVTVDAASHTVAATVSHFSIFALFTGAAEGSAPAAESTPSPTVTATAEATTGGDEAAVQPTPTSTPQSPLVFAPVAALAAMLLLGKRR
jgi:PKD repeat protein